MIAIVDKQIEKRNTMSILKLKPATKDYLWGGHRLADEYGVEFDGPVLAEAWELSCHPDGPSMITNGEYAGKSLKEFIDSEGFDVLGKNCARFREFPILTKFIDAKDNLSIQVHPDNAYALKNENQYGKTEMWYILDAEPGAFLYYGFKKEISKEEFEQRIKENTLLEVLNAQPVKKGDAFLIKAGTLHAIGKGILIAEIQQNSNVTYRIYDYARRGKDGKLRDLHIAQSLDVTERKPVEADTEGYPHIFDTDYFTVDKLNLDGKTCKEMRGHVDEASFLSVLILDGKGTIASGEDVIGYGKGDSFFLPANSGDWKIEGVCDALLTTIRAKENPIVAKVNVSDSSSISFVNEKEEVLATKNVESKDYTTVAKAVMDFINEKEIPIEQVVDVQVSGSDMDLNKANEEFTAVIPCPVHFK